MSKNRDYTRYSKPSVETNESVESIEIDEPVETVMEDVQIEEVKQELKIEESKIKEPEIKEPEPIIGVVTDCIKLNVRARPNQTAMILGVITAATELIIIEEESTRDFYKICTSAGLEGYCMKKFISIMP